MLRLAVGVLCLAGCGGEPRPATIQPPIDTKTTTSIERQPTLARLPFELDQPPAARSSRPDDWFEDVTEASGVNFRYRTGCEARYYTILESVGGGVAMFDFDNDGDLDIFLPGGGTLAAPAVTVSGSTSALYRNDGDWRFTDVTVAMGLNATDLYTHGAEVADYNRDSFPDLLVTGYGGCRLYQNLSGQRFADVTAQAGLVKDRWFTSASWGDLDRDGWVDLFAVCYADWNRTDDVCYQHRHHNRGQTRDTCAPTRYSGQQSLIWRNQGDGAFSDISAAAGIVPGKRSLGIVTADLDGDGWLDWFVANDVQENQLYWGTDELPLNEGGVLAGAALSEIGERDGSMGTDISDVDGDGKLDLFYANYVGQDNVLLRGIGHRGFMHATHAYGLSAASRPWVGFGSLFADFDLDGWLDLFVANGHVLYDAADSPYLQPAQLFQNRQGQKFLEVTDVAGPYFSVPHPGRGAAFGDLDNDGAMDLVVVHQDQPVTILRNRHHAEHWVRLSLHGKQSGRNPAGAKVLMKRDGRTMTQVLRGGGSYLSHSDDRILFTIPTDTPAEVTVVWPGGTSEVFSGLSLRTTHELVEGAGHQP